MYIHKCIYINKYKAGLWKFEVFILKYICYLEILEGI